MSAYWDQKVARVAKIAAKNGFAEWDEEFWKRQPAGVVSLIDQLNAEKNEIELDYIKEKIMNVPT